jgi:hypothetical protein
MAQWLKAGSSFSGCPGTALQAGWYEYGGTTPIATTFVNPSTGVRYSQAELSALAGGGAPVTTPVATTPTGTPATTTPTTTPTSAVPTTSQLEATPVTSVAAPPGLTSLTNPTTYMNFASWVGVQGESMQGMSGEEKAWMYNRYKEWLANLNASATTTTPATTTPAETTPTTSQLEAGVSGGVQPSGVDPHLGLPATTGAGQVSGIPVLPAYQPSAAMEELSTQVGGAIGNIIEQGGLGMGEDTKEQIFLREAEIINANTAQANKNLEDKMAVQGLSNSGMAFSEGMKLASKNSIAMANVMRDVEIQDSLMKVASYQNALGLGVQFLSYLSEESWREYQPTLYQWQAKVDMYKLAITDAYNKQDIAFAHRNAMELAQFTAQTNIQLTQMTIDAAAKAADKDNFMEIVGTLIGGVASVASAFLMA